MDCITISAYRSLEQQAIRQYKEAKLRENNRQIYTETFKKENANFVKSHRVNKEAKVDLLELGKKVLDYFA